MEITHQTGSSGNAMYSGSGWLHLKLGCIHPTKVITNVSQPITPRHVVTLLECSKTENLMNPTQDGLSAETHYPAHLYIHPTCYFLYVYSRRKYG